MNHPTKLTVVWGRPDFAVVFLHTNHCIALHIRVGLAQALPNNKYTMTTFISIAVTAPSQSKYIKCHYKMLLGYSQLHVRSNIAYCVMCCLCTYQYTYCPTTPSGLCKWCFTGDIDTKLMPHYGAFDESIDRQSF